MNCEQVTEKIWELGKKGSRYGLKTTFELARAVGNPQKRLRFIHIAGTNGKGSVLAFISAVLQAAGYKVGQYVSPAVTDSFEKIQINGKSITREEYCKIGGYILDVCGKKGIDPTLFELETVMSFLYFAKNNCSIVVMETGLGGAEDSTNIVDTVVLSVITSIGIDHIEILGGSIEKIAAAKAGIIKKGVPVCIAENDSDVTEILKTKAEQMGCKLNIAYSSDILVKKCNIDGSVFDYGGFKNIEICMPGGYQLKNAALALEAFKALKKLCFDINEDTVRLGMKNARWRCRLEVIGREPLFICDGAHNPHGARALRESIEAFFGGKKPVFILGILKDKDYFGIINELLPVMGSVFAITPPNERGLDGQVIKSILNEKGIECECADIRNAVDLAIKRADKNGVVVACGSLSYLGEVLKYGKSKFNTQKQ